ncbi:MAG: ComEC/Rec2 family competence protein [Chloroflexi bacterium]|nr:ComEC/Rec2 family competence protein [Chloroflexota bacterium]
MKLSALAAAWLAGMALAYYWYDAAPLPLLLVAGLFLSLALLCRAARIASWPAALLAVCLLGMWRLEASQPEPTLLPIDWDNQAYVQGRIASDPELTATRIKFTLEAQAVSSQPHRAGMEWEAANTRLIVYAHPPEELPARRGLPYYQFGDRVELAGTLQQPEPIEGFDYPAYLENKGIHGVFWADASTLVGNGDSKDGGGLTPAEARDRVLKSIFGLRRTLADGLERSLPPREAALAQALLLGLRGQLPDEVVEDFRQSGTSHLLAISGLHLGILLLLSLGTFQWALGRHTVMPVVMALAVLWAYVVISGAPASVVRAAIMGSVYLAAVGLGRPRESLLPALALSVVIMTAVDPEVVTQISFQLSFAAMAGIVLALPWQEAVSRSITVCVAQRQWPGAQTTGAGLGWLVSGVIISAAATLATFPLVALHFGQFPLLGIPATILATPLLPFALVGGLAAGVAGAIHPLPGQLVGMTGSIPLSALMSVVELAPKWTVGVATTGSGLLLVWYGLFLGALVLSDTHFYRTRVQGRLGLKPVSGGQSSPAVWGETPQRAYPALVGVGLVLLASLFYLLFDTLEGSDGRLHVYFIDVGQGDSALIVTPGGRRALVDGGPDYNGATRALSHHLPRWDRRLDLVAATHLDADHSRGLLRVLENFQPKTVVAGTPDSDSHLYPQWRKALADSGHHVKQLSEGQTLSLEEGVSLEVLHPPAVPLRGPAWDSNNNSLVLRLTYGELSFLLTGDIEEEAERYLVRKGEGLESEVLKAGHHGSNSSTTRAFLRAVQPRWAVVSAGADNQYGHPHPEVLERLSEAVGEGNIYSTATQGTIHFTTDGARLWVETDR